MSSADRGREGTFADRVMLAAPPVLCATSPSSSGRGWPGRSRVKGRGWGWGSPSSWSCANSRIGALRNSITHAAHGRRLSLPTLSPMAATAAAATLAAATSSFLRRSPLVRPHGLRAARHFAPRRSSPLLRPHGLWVSCDFAPRRFVRHAASSTNEEAAARAAAATADTGGPTIFDKIIAKEIPSSIVYEDEKVLAFRDINPQAPVHVLVIPKLRDGLTGLDKAEPRHADILGQLLYAAKVVAEKEGVADGYRVVINNGAEGCQSVYHLHVHVLGGRQMKWPPG